EMLTDPERTAFIAVLLSEDWVVEQSKHLIEEVRADGIDVPMAILNRAAPQCDCERCRRLAKRDGEARKALQPIRVVDAPRSCVPLDTPERIREWSDVIPSAARDPLRKGAGGPSPSEPALSERRRRESNGRL